MSGKKGSENRWYNPNQIAMVLFILVKFGYNIRWENRKCCCHRNLHLQCFAQILRKLPTTDCLRSGVKSNLLLQ